METGRMDALERVAACLQAMDDLDAEWASVRTEFKARREKLSAELHTARVDVDQMRLDEQFIGTVETRQTTEETTLNTTGSVWRGAINGEQRTIVLPLDKPERDWRVAEEIEAGVPMWAGEGGVA